MRDDEFWRQMRRGLKALAEAPEASEATRRGVGRMIAAIDQRLAAAPPPRNAALAAAWFQGRGIRVV
jgi:hypothetical protein